MFDILLLAFQTDSTRVASLLLAHDGSNRSAEIGIPEGHHDLSHHFGNAEKIAKIADIDLWYSKQLANFRRKAARHEGRGRPFAAAQLNDSLRQRQLGRQPAFAR